MWQRFTERTRRVIFFAQEEAAQLGGNFVGTEHLLLGLVREEDSLAGRILMRLGVAPSVVRTGLQSRLTRGDSPPSSEMQLTPRAKRVIDLAYEEARNLNNNYIGTEHLLIALIREDEGLGCEVLREHGLTLNSVRADVRAIQDGEGELKRVATLHIVTEVGPAMVTAGEVRRIHVVTDQGVFEGELVDVTIESIVERKEKDGS